jgi:serine/threonine-protein kinase
MSLVPKAAPLCAHALGAIGDPRAIDPLIGLSMADDFELREKVHDALKAMSQGRTSPEERQRIRVALTEAGHHAATTRIAPLAPTPTAPPQDQTTQLPHPGQPPATQISQPSGSPSGQMPSPGAAPPAAERPAAHTVHDSMGAARSTRGGRAPVNPASYQELPPGAVLLERYRIVRKIGSGGFGTVYLAEDMTVKDELILKVLSPHISVDETMLRRFVHELKYARRVTHKNIIRIHDLLELEAGHAISMEYFPGEDLGAILAATERLPVARALLIAQQICEGLSAAHAEGIVHRDIKPPNILVGEGEVVKIVDFGLASMAQNVGSRLTRSGILIGTPQYMAPEQIRGGEVDARADIYSLGVVMYEMFSGHQPFGGENAVNILFKHLEGEIKPLRELVKDIPPEVDQLVMSAMARERENRPETIDQLLGQIREAAA